jgi:hypothetical protein
MLMSERDQIQKKCLLQETERPYVCHYLRKLRNCFADLVNVSEYPCHHLKYFLEYVIFVS